MKQIQDTDCGRKRFQRPTYLFWGLFFAMAALSCDSGHPTVVDTQPEEECEPQCEGQECGEDGCGGSCGTCPEGLLCDVAMGMCGQTGCGNEVIEPGETCDPPSSCPTDCDDGDPCTLGRMTGSPQNCNVVCHQEPITSCTDGDDCCPVGCNASNDSDCGATCGNEVIEPGETCDPPSSCPTDCDDGNPCTLGRMTGSPQNCDVVCHQEPITSCTDGDDCCPAGCTVDNDNDCTFDCRNPNDWPANWAAFEEDVVVLMNAHRAQGATCGDSYHGPTGPLTLDPALREASRCHSLDMGSNNYFSHAGLDGSTPWDRIADAGYTASPTGENIAAGQNTAQEVMEVWMNSPGHCSNIMSSSSNETGVGFASVPGSRYTRYWTETFGRRN